jgi:glycerol uptake facilitator-like aquaporin
MRGDVPKYLLVAILGGIVGALLVVLGLKKVMPNMMPRLMAGMMHRRGEPKGTNMPDI